MHDPLARVEAGNVVQQTGCDYQLDLCAFGSGDLFAIISHPQRVLPPIFGVVVGIEVLRSDSAQAVLDKVSNLVQAIKICHKHLTFRRIDG
jgi:hypothetical protein